MVQKKLREKAKELLAEKEVDLIIGFGEGTLPSQGHTGLSPHP